MAETATEDFQQHPNPTPNPHHRKIELQSHADLTFLQQNLAKASREKLDLHFPPQHSTKQAAPAEVITLGGAPQPTDALQSNGTGDGNAKQGEEREDDEDSLRRNVRLLVDSFLQQTFQSASHSISVNGIDATSLPPSQLPTCSNPIPSPDQKDVSVPLSLSEEVEGIHYTYETFDPRLAKKLSSLYSELESLTSQVSKLRKDAPKQAVKTYTAQLHAVLAKEEEDWEFEQARVSAEQYEGLQLEPVRKGWNEDVRDIYGRGVEGLAVLSGVEQNAVDTSDMMSLTETMGKVQRARGVIMEFE